MFNTKGTFTYVLAIIFLSGIKSYADTFIVTNLNDPGRDIDCIFTNTKTGGGGNGGCSLAPSGTNYTFPLYLFVPALIMVRKIIKKCR